MASPIGDSVRYFKEHPGHAWLAAILIGGAVHLGLWPLSEPPWLFSDFYKAYWAAGEHLWNGGLNATYPFTIPGNWSNLPVLGWPFALLVPFGHDAAGWIFLAVGVPVVVATWALLCRIAGLSGVRAAGLLFLFLISGPLLNALKEGNSTHFVLFFMVLGLALWQSRREYAAGLAFGMCATIKPPLLLIGVFFFVRRRWPVVAGGATTIIVFVAASLLLFGIAGNLAWYDEIVGANLGNVMPAFNVQSIDGFLIRLQTGTTELLYWGQMEPSLLHKIVRNAIFAVLIGGFAWLMLRSERRELTSNRGDAPTPHDFMQFSMIILLSLVMSPVSWTHYYAFLLIPVALQLGGKLPLPDDAVSRWLFWGGYVLTAIPVIMPAMQLDPDPPPGWLAELAARTILSAWLYGALLMLACFARAAWLATSRQTAHAESDDRVSTSRA